MEALMEVHFCVVHRLCCCFFHTSKHVKVQY